MMKKNNRKCICCQKEYTFCPNCGDFDNLPRWMSIFHDENCKKIFNTITEYYNKNLTKEQAKETLNKCDLSNKDTFKETIKKAIEEIYIDENVIVEQEIKEVIINEEKNNNVENLQDNKEIKYTKNKKRNNNINMEQIDKCE